MINPISLPRPYLLFLGDIHEPLYAKAAYGLRDWARDSCVGEFSGSGGTISADLPSMTPEQARAAGAGSLVIGVANPGGTIPDAWVPALLQSLEAGLDLIGGMHARLCEIPQLREAAERLERRLIDVRQPPPGLVVASGRKRSGKRLLTVGTDCALGKKYAAIRLAREFHARGVSADYRATGQTGILIAGGGIAMDAVVSDFAAGAAEALSPDAGPGHWDIIEGQGSLFHPAYAGVSLALLHGSQPDLVVVCHDPGRPHMLGYPDYPMPSVEDARDLTLSLGRRTNPDIRCAGFAFNTSSLDEDAAERLMAAESERLGCPVADPMRGGKQMSRLVEACLQ